MQNHTVAIPHGDPQFINKPFVAVITLTKPITMRRMDDATIKLPVDTLFTLGLTNGSDHLDLLKEIMKLLQTDSFVQQIKNCTNKDEVETVIRVAEKRERKILMTEKLNILVACGSGVATSTIAADDIEDVCREYGITNYAISKCSMTEMPSMSQNYDIVFTTNNYRGKIDTPLMSVTGFITGINTAELRQKVGEKLLSLTKDRE
ncbi:PTS sugar transporter subunit IIA [Lactobacillus sp. R2/2]|nr:PTS sugar transporter subunit IIA [Lactobacillus sp. R2/2]